MTHCVLYICHVLPDGLWGKIEAGFPASKCQNANC